MNLQRVLSGACLALSLVAMPLPAAAQLGLPAGLVDSAAPIETAHLRITVVRAEAPVAAGARVSLALEVEPKTSMHVYAPEQKGFIPASLRLEPNPKFAARPAIFSKGEAATFA